MEILETKKNRKIAQIFKCESCDYITCNHYDFVKHSSTAKHKKMTNISKMEVNTSKMEVMEMEKNRITDTQLYNCNCCNFSNINRVSYEKHIASKKHLLQISVNKETTMYTCEFCNKEYLNSSGLWKHNKKCREPLQSVDKPNNMMDMFLAFMQQNSELQNTIREQSKQLVEITKTQSTIVATNTNNNNANNTNTNNNNNNNTTNNTQFNLQFFLNETCKDAMNIMDFVNSLPLKIEDFEETGKLGYIEGISKIIINGLNKMDTTKRPIHCTDVKRETLYIKHENTWEKEEPCKTKLKRAVNQVARMNLSQLPRWQEENPASEVLDTREHVQYMKYSMAALGGRGEEEEERFMNKIMKNVMKEVVLDKDKIRN